MTMPKAYEPQQGQQYQILTRYLNQSWEHCDYAENRTEKNYLLGEYYQAYGDNHSFKTIKLPKKYHKKTS